MIIPFIKNRKRALIFLLFVITLLFGAKQLLLFKPEVPQSTVVKRGDVKKELTLSGEINAEEKTELKFQTAGLLSWVGVKEGDVVQKYQGIASLDTRQLKKTLEKKLNEYSTTRWNFEQTQDDYENQIVNDKIKRILEKAQFDLNNAVIDVELQSLAVELSSLWTPIDGMVTRVDTPFASVNVTPTQPLFEIVNPKSIYLETTADQSEVISLKEGMMSTVTLDAYPDSNLKGIINFVSFSPKTDEAATVYKVAVSLDGIDNTNYQYKIGMTGDATFILEERKNVLYLPIRFVKSDEQGTYILLGKNRIKTYISTGLEGDENVEVIGNVKEGDVVYD